MTESDGELRDLTADELAAVTRVVHALVANDGALLRSVGAYDDGADPYLWTRDYGQWRQVDLVVPPGEPRDWLGQVMRWDSDPGFAAVAVNMWTEQEGPSDLTLELDLTAAPDGSVAARFKNLHVM